LIGNLVILLILLLESYQLLLYKYIDHNRWWWSWI